MNSRLMDECQQSFYKELYHMDRPGYSVVTDETTGKIKVTFQFSKDAVDSSAVS